MMTWKESGRTLLQHNRHSEGAGRKKERKKERERERKKKRAGAVAEI